MADYATLFVITYLTIYSLWAIQQLRGQEEGEGGHTVAIWTFPFHQNSVKKSDDFLDLTLAQ